MNIYQIVVIGVVSAILSILLKKDMPEFAILISIACGVLIFLLIIPKLAAVLQLLNKMSDKISLENGYIKILLKVLGISYIAEFGTQLCVDAGEKSIASKIELAGKVMILLVAAPIFLSLMDLIVNFGS